MIVALTGTFAVGFLAACGADDDAATGTDEATTTDEDGAAGEAEADGSRVDLSDTSLGEILVDGEGRTLYLFTVDEPGQSNCEDECLDAWPPLEGEATAGEGVNADLLGTIEREDGSIQATYADWPLYYFAADEAPGDLNGQGVNDVWYVIDAQGNAVEDSAEEDSGY
jgi:predicted lipoprotein with Yx(FWY)xxD motif